MESSGVFVTLEWTLDQDSFIYAHNVSVVPEVVELTFNRSRGLQLMLSYNTLYNVTVVATHPCGQHVESVVQLYYGKSQDHNYCVSLYMLA